MKKRIVKGFTLIELIVVMAIFMIVTVAAMSLMTPVSKIMTLSEVRESGSAQVNSIGKYLQSQFGSAEYIWTSNSIPADNGRAYVDEFVELYYEGTLMAGSTPQALNYGTGKVHVMTIDNTQDGKISEWVYNVSLKLHDGTSYITSLDSYQEYAVNKAYYDNTSYLVEIGLKKGSVDQIVDDTDYVDFMRPFNSRDTSFTITANMTRGSAAHPQVYTFSTTASTPMVNIAERMASAGGCGCVSGKYYVVNEFMDTSVTPAAFKQTIADITSAQLSSKTVDPSLTLSRQNGGLQTVEPVQAKVIAGNPVNGATSKFTFIYTFGSEMKTS